MAKKASKAGKYEAKYANKVSEKTKKSGKKVFSTILIILVAICFVAAASLGVYLYFFSGVTPGLIMDNVSVLGVDVGGMSTDDAAEVIDAAFINDFCQKTMVVTMYEQHVEISAETAGITLDAAGAAEAAYKIGRTGSQAQRKMEQTKAALGGIDADASAYLSFNEEALRTELDALFAHFSTEVVDGSWEITGELPDLSAEDAPEETQTLVVNTGTPGYALDMDSLLSQVKEAYAHCEFTVEYVCEVTNPTAIDLQSIYEETSSEPVEAQMDKETFEVTPHAYGYSFDLENAQALLKETAFGESFEVPFSTTAPTHTKAGLEAILFRDVLGTYTAYASSYPSTRDVNLKLSCQAINGTILMPDEVFSYNPTLGERTAEAGWKPADAYVGSETVKTYGGGICQTSSCLYLSALLADMEIVERVNHGFISSYVPFGMDATVSWGGPEFRFKNSSEYPIRIEAWSNGGAVTVQLVGTDTKDYYVKMTYDVLSTDPFETVYKEMDKDNKNGYKDGEVITSGYTGYKIRTYRCKYSKETDELLSSEVEVTSTYARRDKVVCKIKKDEATQPSTEPITTPTTEPTTQPPTEETTVAPTEENTVAPTEETTEGTVSPGIDGSVTEDN